MTQSGIAPSLIFHGGSIITLDDDTNPEAMAILGDKIVAIGTEADLMSLSGTKTRHIDLAGRTLIPGMIDNHTHYMLAGLDSPEVGVRVNIAQCRSIAEQLDMIGAKAAALEPGAWVITSCMYRGPLAEGRFPNRHDLDQVATDNPVYVFQSGKNIIVNSVALEMAGIGADTPDPTDPEGHIVRDEQGIPTGHLIAGAADLARSRWWARDGLPPKMWDFPYYDEETLIQALEAQGRIYHACGIVGVRDMGLAPHELSAYQAAKRQGRLPVRVDAVLGLPARYLPTEEIERRIRDYFGPRTGFGDQWLRIAGLKLVVQNDGWWAYSPDKLRRIVMLANTLGWSLAFHVSSGDAPDATELVLDILEEADRENPVSGRYFSFEHGLGLRRPEHIARIGALGLVVAANPLLSHFGAGRTVAMHSAIGGTRITKTRPSDAHAAAAADWGLPLRAWLDAGLLVTGGTDNPAVVYDPAQPLKGMHVAVTGQTLAGVLTPGQQATRMEALRMWTVNNARAMGQEDTRGSLRVGKLADLVVLSGDFMGCSDDEFAEMLVDVTVINGEVVFERGST
ncbi:MAG TPA: amidohydrolase, partial [Pseudonocardiaceae bacterium]|nr:amidohydrolase [Pseudonocardiaceae bacterium]